jgi:hypothetical protein
MYWNTGILEYWNTGILEYWNTGILEYWNTGILEYWNTEALAEISRYRNTGTLRHGSQHCYTDDLA